MGEGHGDVLTINEENEKVQVSATKADGSPAAGVELKVEQPNGIEATGGSATTDSEGKAWLGMKGTIVGMATYLLAAAQGGGKAPATQAVGKHTIQAPNISAHQGELDVKLPVTVRLANGKPAVGAVVEGSGPGVVSGTTDAQGKVDLTLNLVSRPAGEQKIVLTVIGDPKSATTVLVNLLKVKFAAVTPGTIHLAGLAGKSHPTSDDVVIGSFDADTGEPVGNIMGQIALKHNAGPRAATLTIPNTFTTGNNGSADITISAAGGPNDATYFDSFTLRMFVFGLWPTKDDGVIPVLVENG